MYIAVSSTLDIDMCARPEEDVRELNLASYNNIARALLELNTSQRVFMTFFLFGIRTEVDSSVEFRYSKGKGLEDVLMFLISGVYHRVRSNSDY